MYFIFFYKITINIKYLISVRKRVKLNNEKNGISSFRFFCTQKRPTQVLCLIFNYFLLVNYCNEN